MLLSITLAKHFREVYFGGNWTWVNLKTTLEGVDWKQATTQIESYNTIANLVYHIHYYVHAVIGVLKGGTLDAHDKYAFDHPSINSQKDWEDLLKRNWEEAEEFAGLLEKFPEEKWDELLADEKYGNYFRNILGIIEHTHYHLGQIVIIKKMLANPAR